MSIWDRLLLAVPGGRALVDEPPLLEDEQPVGDAAGLVEVVGGEEDAAARAAHARDELPEAAAPARVERGGRLVEEQHRRLPEQADREVQPLLVPDGELDRAPLLHVEPDLRESTGDGGARVGEAGQAGEELEVLARGEPAVERRPLRHPAHLRGGGDAAAARAKRAGQDREQRGLAGAVRAAECDHLAGADLQVGRLEHDAAPEPPGHAAGGEERRRQDTTGGLITTAVP